MPYYLIYRGQGRTVLRADLDAEDPFGLTGSEIVDRVSAAGATPDVAGPRAKPWPMTGTGRVDEVMRQGLTLLVAVSRDTEEISMQEFRADPCDGVE